MKTKLMIGLFGMLSSVAWAAPSSFSFSGTLFTPGTSNPILDAAVTLKLEIYNPAGTCLLYQEIQTVNTAGTNGDFSVSVGSDVGNPKRGGGDPGLAWATIYQSVGLITGCYTAAVGDPPRVLRVTVTTSVLPATTLTPDYALNAVPMATIADNLSPNSTINGSLTLDNGIMGLKMASGPQVGFMGPASGTPYTMTLPGNSGSSGNALTTDGTGNLSWAAMPSGSAVLDGVSASPGSMTYRGSSSWQQISPGSPNMVLAWSGSSPAWSAISYSMLPTSIAAGPYAKVIVNQQGIVTGNATLTISDVPFALANGGNPGPQTVGSMDSGVTVMAAGSPAITVTPTGNVGVGTTAPADMFDVFGNAGVMGSLMVTGPANLMSVMASSGSPSSPSLSMGSPNEGLFDVGGSIGFSTGAVERMRIVSGSGAVGIGTTNPNAQLLDVSSNAMLSTFPQVNINNTNPSSSMPAVQVRSQGNAPTMMVANMGSIGGALMVGTAGAPIRQIAMVTAPGSPCGTVTAGTAFTCTVTPAGFTPPIGSIAHFIQCTTTASPFVSVPGVFNAGQFILGGVAQSSGSLTPVTFNCQVTSF